MTNGHGGYRRPANPAPVSGPGAHSRRTDGQPIRSLPDAEYGEDKTFGELQRGAPLASQPSAQGSPGPALTPLSAPTALPNTPVTAGAGYGAGPGVDALGLPQSLEDMSKADAGELRRYLPVLIDVAQRPDTPQGTRDFVRELISYL